MFSRRCLLLEKRRICPTLPPAPRRRLASIRPLPTRQRDLARVCSAARWRKPEGDSFLPRESTPAERPTPSLQHIHEARWCHAFIRDSCPTPCGLPSASAPDGLGRLTAVAATVCTSR